MPPDSGIGAGFEGSEDKGAQTTFDPGAMWKGQVPAIPTTPPDQSQPILMPQYNMYERNAEQQDAVNQLYGPAFQQQVKALQYGPGARGTALPDTAEGMMNRVLPDQNQNAPQLGQMVYYDPSTRSATLTKTESPLYYDPGLGAHTTKDTGIQSVWLGENAITTDQGALNILQSKPTTDSSRWTPGQQLYYNRQQNAIVSAPTMIDGKPNTAGLEPLYQDKTGGFTVSTADDQGNANQPYIYKPIVNQSTATPTTNYIHNVAGQEEPINLAPQGFFQTLGTRLNTFFTAVPMFAQGMKSVSPALNDLVNWVVGSADTLTHGIAAIYNAAVSPLAGTTTVPGSDAQYNQLVQTELARRNAVQASQSKNSFLNNIVTQAVGGLADTAFMMLGSAVGKNISNAFTGDTGWWSKMQQEVQANPVWSRPIMVPYLAGTNQRIDSEADLQDLMAQGKVKWLTPYQEQFISSYNALNAAQAAYKTLAQESADATAALINKVVYGKETQQFGPVIHTPTADIMLKHQDILSKMGGVISGKGNLYSTQYNEFNNKAWAELKSGDVGGFLQDRATAINIYRAAGADTGLFDPYAAFSWSEHPDQEQKFIKAVAEYEAQIGRPLTGDEISRMKDRFSDPWAEMTGMVIFDPLKVVDEPLKVLGGTATALTKNFFTKSLEVATHLGEGGKYGTGAFLEGMASIARSLSSQSVRTAANSLRMTINNILLNVAHGSKNLEEFRNTMESLGKAVTLDDAPSREDLSTLLGKRIAPSEAEGALKVGNAIKINPKLAKAGLDPNVWGTWIDETVQKAKDLESNRLIKDFWNMKDPEAQNAAGLKLLGKDTITDEMRATWHDDINKALQAQADAMYEGPVKGDLVNLLSNDVKNQYLRAYAATPNVLDRAYNAVLGTWSKAVLSFRPAWAMRNWIDMAGRAAIYGVNVFDSIDILSNAAREDFMKAFDQLTPSELDNTFLRNSLTKTGSTLSERIMRGEAPSTIPGLFWDNFKRGQSGVSNAMAAADNPTSFLGQIFKRTGAGISSFGNSVNDWNNAIESATRIRLYTKMYGENMDILNRWFSSEAEKAMAKIGLSDADKQSVRSIMAMYPHNAEGLRQALNGLRMGDKFEGQYFKFMGEGLDNIMKDLDPITRINLTEDVARKLNSTMSVLRTNGQEMDEAATRKFFDDLIGDSREKSNALMNAPDTRHAEDLSTVGTRVDAVTDGNHVADAEKMTPSTPDPKNLRAPEGQRDALNTLTKATNPKLVFNGLRDTLTGDGLASEVRLNQNVTRAYLNRDGQIVVDIANKGVRSKAAAREVAQGIVEDIMGIKDAQVIKDGMVFKSGAEYDTTLHQFLTDPAKLKSENLNAFNFFADKLNKDAQLRSVLTSLRDESVLPYLELSGLSEEEKNLIRGGASKSEYGRAAHYTDYRTQGEAVKESRAKIFDDLRTMESLRNDPEAWKANGDLLRSYDKIATQIENNFYTWIRESHIGPANPAFEDATYRNSMWAKYFQTHAEFSKGKVAYEDKLVNDILSQMENWAQNYATKNKMELAGLTYNTNPIEYMKDLGFKFEFDKDGELKMITGPGYFGKGVQYRSPEGLKEFKEFMWGKEARNIPMNDLRQIQYSDGLVAKLNNRDFVSRVQQQLDARAAAIQADVAAKTGVEGLDANLETKTVPDRRTGDEKLRDIVGRFRKGEALQPEERDYMLKGLTDAISGLPGKRMFELFGKGQEYQKNLSKLFFDANFLKSINDTYGHEAGDQVIKAIGDAAKKVGLDLGGDLEHPMLFNAGGDEFIAFGKAEELRTKMQALKDELDKVRLIFNELDEHGNPTGKVHQLNGIKFEGGVGRTTEKADQALLGAKQARDEAAKKAGTYFERGGRGKFPPDAITDVTGQAPAPAVAPAAQAGVPVMITNEMRGKLAEIGKTADEIKNMTPQQAWDAIHAADPNWKVTPTPAVAPAVPATPPKTRLVNGRIQGLPNDPEAVVKLADGKEAMIRPFDNSAGAGKYMTPDGKVIKAEDIVSFRNQQGDWIDVVEKPMTPVAPTPAPAQTPTPTPTTPTMTVPLSEQEKAQVEAAKASNEMIQKEQAYRNTLNKPLGQITNPNDRAMMKDEFGQMIMDVLHLEEDPSNIGITEDFMGSLRQTTWGSRIADALPKENPRQALIKTLEDMYTGVTPADSKLEAALRGTAMDNLNMGVVGADGTTIRPSHPWFYQQAGHDQDMVDFVSNLWQERWGMDPNDYLANLTKSADNAQALWEAMLNTRWYGDKTIGQTWGQIAKTQAGFEAYLKDLIANSGETLDDSSQEALSMLLWQVQNYRSVAQNFGEDLGLFRSRNLEALGKVPLAPGLSDMPDGYKTWFASKTEIAAQQAKIEQALADWRDQIIKSIQGGDPVLHVSPDGLNKFGTLGDDLADLKVRAADMASRGAGPDLLTRAENILGVHLNPDMTEKEVTTWVKGKPTKVWELLDDRDKATIANLQHNIDQEQELLRQSGFNGEGALPHTQRVMIDYNNSNRLDEGMRYIFPFWMFGSRSTTMWLETLATHPDILSFYQKYMMLSKDQQYHEGFMTSSGGFLPSLDGYFEIPGTGVWVDPLAPLSMRYIFPKANNFEENYADAPLLAKILGGITDNAATWGFMLNPLWSIPLQGVGATKLGLPMSPIIPQMDLIPQWWRESILDGIQKINLDGNARPFVPPNTINGIAGPILGEAVPWKDYLVEREILSDALTKIHQTQNPDEQMSIAAEAQKAIQNHAGDLWQTANRHIDNSSLYSQWNGYFTGIYSKQYTDGTAALSQLAAERNALRDQINSAVRADIFQADPDPEARYNKYVDQRYNTPDGYIGNIYNLIRYQQTPDGKQLVGQDRRDNLSKQITQGLESSAYYDSVKAITNTLNSNISKMPIGTPYSSLKQFYDDYYAAKLKLETSSTTADAVKQWSYGYKPDSTIEDHFRNMWFMNLRMTQPQYADYSDYAAYQAAMQNWQQNIPQIAQSMYNAMGNTLIPSVFQAPAVGAQEAAAKQKEEAFVKQSTAALNNLLTTSISGGRTLNVKALMDDLLKQSNAQGFDLWNKSNQTPYEALDAAWTAMYYNKFWTDMAGLSGDQLNAAKIAWKQMNPTPTPEALAQWVLDNYPKGIFTHDQLVQTASGSGVLSFDDRTRISQAADQNGQYKQDIWDVLNSIGPGQDQAFKDQLDAIGGKYMSEHLSQWYELQDKGFKTGQDFKDFHDAVVKTAQVLKIPQPDLATYNEWAQAKQQNDAFTQQKDAQFPNVDTAQSAYYGTNATTAEKRIILQNNPDLAKYWNFRDQYATAHPLWAKYYTTAGKQAALNEGTATGIAPSLGQANTGPSMTPGGLNYIPPVSNTAEYAQYVHAQALNKQLQDQLDQLFQPTFFNLMDTYYNSSKTVQANLKANFPEIQQYFNYRDAFGKANPDWQKFYGYNGATGTGTGTGTGSSGYYSSSSTSTKAKKVTIAPAHKVVPLGYRSNLNARQLTPMTIGKKAGGTITVPALTAYILPDTLKTKLTTGQPLNTIDLNFLNNAKATHPDQATSLQEIIDNAPHGSGGLPQKML